MNDRLDRSRSARSKGAPGGRAEGGARPLKLAMAIRAALLPAGMLLGMHSGVVFAGPQGGQVVAGSGSIAKPNATTTVVTQKSQNLAVDWQKFNVNASETVQFKQPGQTATALNRIFDQHPSQIYGQIKANGQVFLMNPNGILFGPSARVNVGGLVAAGASISVDDFMAGKYKLDASSGGTVVNQGVIEAATGGSVTLAGGAVSNQGVIVANAGRVNLVGGSKMTLDFDGDGLMKFTVDAATLKNATGADAAVSNAGRIQADGGTVVLSAKAAQNVFSHVVNNSGVIKAARIEHKGGKVMLVGMGPGSSVLNTGTVDVSAVDGSSGGTVELTGDKVEQAGVIKADASGGDGGTVKIAAADTALTTGNSRTSAQSTAGGKGGTVQILADKVGLLDNSVVDVSGELGGGTAFIGGSFHGADPNVRNASQTVVAGTASIKADATGQGDGGHVAVWSNDSTRYFGSISAEGGATGGDGGFVEVSGKQSLEFAGTVSTRAPKGTAGNLLLDPDSISIVNTGSDSGNMSGTSPFQSTDTNPATLTWQTLEAALTGGNITVQTSSGDITITNGYDFTTNNTASGTLILNSAGNITAAASQTVTGLSALSLTLQAVGTTTIDTNFAGFGTVEFDNATDSTYSGVISGTGGITMSGVAVLTLSGTNTYTGVTYLSDGTLSVSTLANGGVNSNIGGSASTAGYLVLDGGTLKYTGAAQSTDRLFTLGASGGTLDGSGTGALTFSNTGSIAISGAGTRTLTLTGTATGNTLTPILADGANPTSLTKAGTGSWVLSGTNTYTGTTAVNAGTLAVTVDQALGTTAGGTTVASGAVLDFQNVTYSTTEGLTLNGGTVSTSTGTSSFAGGITLGATSTANVGSGAQLTLSGVITDGASTFGLLKSGSGTLVISGANDYDGATTVNGGTLQLGAAGVIKDSSVVSLANTVGVVFDLNGNNETVGSLTGGGANGGNVTLGSATLTVGGDNSSRTYAGVISGTGGLTKTGTGTLTLSGANTYTGATTISAGTLQVGGTGAVIADGSALVDNGTLDLAGNNETVGSLAGSGGVTNSSGTGATLTAGGDNTSTTYSGVAQNGSSTVSLTKAGTGTLTLSGANTYTGATTISSGTLQLGAAGVIADGSALVDNGTFDLNGNSETVGSLAGSGGVTSGVAGAVMLTAGGDNTSTTYSGVAQNGSATVSLTKTGTGTLKLTGANTYTGGTTISAGTLQIGDAGTTGSIAGDVTDNGTLTFNRTNALTFGGVVSGSGALTQAGTGTLTLSGANTYTGATTISAGTLQLGTAGVIADTSALVDNGTLDLAGNSETVGSLAGSGSVTSGGVGAVTLTAGGDNTSTTYSGVAQDGSGTVSLTKAGTGTLTLSGTNTYTGTTTVSAGTLAVTANNALGATGGGTVVASGAVLDFQNVAYSATEALTVNGGTVSTSTGTSSFAGGITLGATSAVDVTGTQLTLSGAIDDGASSFGVTKTGSGILVLSGTNTYDGATTISAGTLQLGTAGVIADTSALVDNGTFDLNGNNETVGSLAGSGGVTNSSATGATLTAGGDNSSTTYSGVAQNGSSTVSLTKTGTGTLTLSGANTYTGATTISAGTLQLGAAGVIADTSALVDNGTLDLAGNNETVGSLAGSGGVTNSVATGATLTAGGDNTSTTYSGVAQNGSGTVSLTKAGTGTLTLSGANTYTGATTISAGTLQLGAAGVIADTSALVDNGTFDLNSHSETVGSLAGTGGVTSSAAGTVTLTAGGDNTSTTYSGVAQNGSATVSLTKTGTGTLTLSGTNTYTGTTTVSAGTLAVTADQALGAASGGTTVNTGGTLDFQNVNYATAEAITLAGGTLRTSTGTSTVAGNISLTSNSAITQANGTSLTLNGTINGGSTLSINSGTGAITFGGIIGGGTPLTAFNVTTAGSVTLNSALTATGASISSTGGVTLAAVTLNSGAGTLTVNVDTDNNSTDTLLLNGALLVSTGTSQFTGGTDNNDTLQIPSGTNNWIISSTAGGGTVNSFAYSQFGNLTGGSGTDNLSFSGVAPVSVTLTALGTSDGFKGTATNLPGSFDNMNTVTGAGNSGDTLTGVDSGVSASASWTISTGVYSATNSLTFSNFANLTGGSANDTFNVDANHTGNLTGGSGNDSFVFTGSAVLTGQVDGGSGGTDSLDFSGYGTSVTINVGGGCSGQCGEVGNNSVSPNVIVYGQETSGAKDDYINIESTSSSAAIGPNGQTNNWEVVGFNQYKLNGGATLTANSLTGGDQIDNFTIDAVGYLNGTTGIDGGPGSNTVISVNNATWNVTGANQGTIDTTSTGGGSTTFTNIQTLAGGANNDAFTFAAGGSISGHLDGGAGTNTANYSAVGTTTITLGTTGNTVDNIGTLTAAAGSTLVAANNANTWHITSDDAGDVTDGDAVGTINFTGFANLTGNSTSDAFIFSDGKKITGTLTGGGTAANETLDMSAYTTAGGLTWNVTGNNAGNVTDGTATINFTNVGALKGSSSVSDTFVFSDNVGVTGTVNGQAGGTDTLDYSAYTASHTVSVDLQAGTATGTGGISGIESLVGGAGSDTLTGPNAGATWTSNAANGGTVAGVTFSSFENWTGGSGNDLFNIGHAISGNVSGGNGSNTYNLNSGGSVGGNLTGGTGNDSIVFNGGSVTGSLDGGAGGTNTLDYHLLAGPVSVDLGTATFSNINNLVGSSGTDTLTGPSSANTWHITGNDAGDINSAISFSSFENLTGNSTSDAFVFSDGKKITGTLTGGGSAANETLDMSAYTTAGGLTWNVTGNNAGNVTDGTVTINFTNVGALKGSSSVSDTFVFSDNVGVTGTVNGQAGGTDTLDYSAYTAAHPVSVDLQAGTATGTGGISGIESLVGGAGSDTLTGPDAGGTWTSNAANGGTVAGVTFSSFENWTGGSGTDTFNIGHTISGNVSGGNGSNTYNLNSGGSVGGNLTGGTGNDSIVYNGGSVTGSLDGGAGGTNTLDYHLLAGPVSVDLGTATFSNINNLVGSSGTDTLTGPSSANTWHITGNDAGDINSAISFSSFENLTGNSTSDAFVFSDGKKITGTLTGGGSAANETLDMSAYTTGLTWNVTGVNAGNVTNGVATINFTNIGTLTGSSSAGDTFNVGGTVSGNINGGNGANTYNVNATLSGNLTGGTGNDSIVFGGAGHVGGNVDAGAGGTNTLNFSGLAGPVSVNLGGGGTPQISGSTSNINNLVGSAGTDTLIGTNAGDTWTSTGTNAGSVAGTTFSSFENWTGGSGNDTFNINNAVTGNVDGGSGSNTFNVTSTVNGNLSGGSGNDVYNVSGSIGGQVNTNGGDDTWNYVAGHSLGSAIVGSSGSLTVPGTSGNPITVSSSDLVLPTMTAFSGNFIIGGTISPTTVPLDSSTTTVVNASKVTVASLIKSGGAIVLLASDIDLDADITAGAGGNDSVLELVAVGNTNGLNGTGDITAKSPVTLSGGSATLIAANTIVNPGQITMDLNGGDLQVAIAAGNPEPTFSAAGSATGVSLNTSTQSFINALGLNLQGVVVSFSNPGAALAALEKIKVIDTGLFEQDLTLFGVIGNGIAMDISQCEDLEGCAPSVTDDQLKKLISGLETKISDLEKLKAEGKSTADTNKQLADYQAKLDSFKSYKTELDQYQKEQQESEEVPSGLEDLGPTLGPGETAPAAGGNAPAAPAPAAPPEAPPENLQEAPAEKAPAAPVPPPEEPPATLEEQELPEKPAAPAAPAAPSPAPAPAPAPAAPAPAPKEKPAAPPPLPELPKSLDSPLEDEEIINPQTSVLPPLVPAAVSSYQWFASAGGASPVWVGDLVMPARHRLY